MGAPGFKVVHGHYKGNGSAVSRPFALTFEPKSVKIWSVNGSAIWNYRMPGALKILDSAVPAFRPAGELVITKDEGFEILSTDAVLNANNVQYYYEAF